MSKEFIMTYNPLELLVSVFRSGRISGWVEENILGLVSGAHGEVDIAGLCELVKPYGKLTNGILPEHHMDIIRAALATADRSLLSATHYSVDPFTGKSVEDFHITEKIYGVRLRWE